MDESTEHVLLALISAASAAIGALFVYLKVRDTRRRK